MFARTLKNSYICLLNVLLKPEPLSLLRALIDPILVRDTTCLRLNDRGVPVSANRAVRYLPLGVTVTTTAESPHLAEDGSVTTTESPGCNNCIDDDGRCV